MSGFLTLDRSGIVLALLLGLLILLLGGVYFLTVMLLFLCLSAIVTAAGRREKGRIGLYESSRSWKNVAANGIVPLVVALLYRVSVITAHPGISWLLLLVYVAGVAAITSDKFASEIGVLDGTPTMLLTLKKVKKGRSGAVTWLGLAASLSGAVVLGVFSLFALAMSNGAYVEIIGIIAVSGFLGNLVDSAFGYYEERGIGNKYTSNILCAVAGCLIGALLIYLLI